MYELIYHQVWNGLEPMCWHLLTLFHSQNDITAQFMPQSPRRKTTWQFLSSMGPECPTQNCRDLNKKTLLPNQRSYIQTHAYDLYNLIYIQYIYIKYKSKIFNVSTLTQRLHPSYWFLHRSCATSSVAFHSSLKTILDCSCTMLFFLNLILSIFFSPPVFHIPSRLMCHAGRLV